MNKQDKSPQGFIDEDIKCLLQTLKEKEYKTTSSCSGRIVLITKSGEKGPARWIFKSHDNVKGKEIFNLVQKNSPVWFLQEPMILHAKAKSLDSAQKLLTLAKNSGLKISGITSIKNCSIEIRGTERMETILTKECSEDYISLLVDKANEKLNKTKQKIKRFLKNLN